MGKLRGRGPSPVARRANRYREHPLNDDDIIKSLGGPTAAFVPPTPERLSRRCSWYADDDRLLLITRPSGVAADAEQALAFGLAYCGDRELWIVTTAEGAALVQPRRPWLVVPIRLFTMTGNDVVEVMPLAKAEVLETFKDVVVSKVAELGGRSSWVADLIAWADNAPGLHPAHRSQYLAWHCDGRQVLVIRPRSSGLEIVAGVDAGTPAPGKNRCR